MIWKDADMSKAIQAENVSIRYMTGDFKSIGLKEYVVRRLTGNYSVKEFWADRGITFTLDKGDMLGIVGTNGAGKSTLLKAVSGIMTPTEGTIHTSGRIAALLELSSGFDPDLTVRENTYLRGALLGYTRAFMNKMYDDIIAFAELGESQDKTFKQLSSGMKSRLAFSIACLVEPDILILDEVLAVGDGAFRKKSEKKMRSILQSGVTAILVSHNISQVRSLCNKIMWLDHGKQICFGDDTETICNAYEEFLATKQVPADEQGVLALAESFARRNAEKQYAAEQDEKQRLVEALNAAPRDAAVKAAQDFLSGLGAQKETTQQ